MGNPMAERNALLGATLVKNLKKRGFEAYYCADKATALAQALSLIPKDHVVSWGGCASVDEIGLKEAVKAEFKTIDRDKAESPEERVEIMRQGLLADTFLMGANAITEEGDLFNIDANGNRTAALIYGPRQVIVVAGMNKITKDPNSAYLRMRNTAAPINVQRFEGRQTPCRVTGTCGDCLVADCCCNYIVRVRRCQPQGKIKVILVGENLGF